jgi:hypothetical protein
MEGLEGVIPHLAKMERLKYRVLYVVSMWSRQEINNFRRKRKHSWDFLIKAASLVMNCPVNLTTRTVRIKSLTGFLTSVVVGVSF